MLRTLPTAGDDVLAGPGENAGVVRIGDGLAVAFKLESHNHPSAVEPFQGAATGVGGILRDVVAMGARPIALLDPLKFGWPDDAATRRLVRGVVRGVGSYGNCVGVPTVGGELLFDPSYTDNPLVNVMCVGLVAENGLARAVARTPGYLAVLYGSPTGRDGIGGASVLASANFGEGPPQMRPSVQIGDPFAGKLLIEASLELVERGLVEGLQDLGAAGLTCAASEMADRGGTGMRIDLDAVPAPRRRHGAVRGDDQRVAGADARRRRAGERGRGPGGVPALGTAIGRRRRRSPTIGDVVVVDGGREIARVPARALASDSIEMHRVWPRRRSAAGPRPRRARRRSPTTACRSAAWIRARSSSRCSATPTWDRERG